MSVYLRGSVWWMEFCYRGQRIRKSTGQLTQEAAEAVERNEKDRLRQLAHGVAIRGKPETPRFQDFAEIYYIEASRKIRRPDRLEFLIRVALSFWGARPEDPQLVYPDGPYHDLRLADPIDDPSWLLKWEQWLARPKRSRPRADGRETLPRVWSGQTKNQYRSLINQMYALAIRPAWRLSTGVSTNPCLGSERDSAGQRIVALEIDDLRAIIAAASPHLRVAMSIALLAPKLRLGDILRLRFDQHVSASLEWLTVDGHKTSGVTGRPLVAYVPEQLRAILAAAKASAPKRVPFVVHYQGNGVTELRGAVRGAVARAAETRPHLTYGRFAGEGITFHTLRHSAATQLAAMGVAPDLRRELMGHEHLGTTQLYTHLRPVHAIASAEQLSAAFPIADLILAEGASVGTSKQDSAKQLRKRADRRGHVPTPDRQRKRA